VVDEKRQLFTQMSTYSLQLEEKENFIAHMRTIDEQQILDASNSSGHFDGRTKNSMSSTASAPAMSCGASSESLRAGAAPSPPSAAGVRSRRSASRYLNENYDYKDSRASMSDKTGPLSSCISPDNLKTELVQLDDEIGTNKNFLPSNIP
jgi:hypothetical protein